MPIYLAAIGWLIPACFLKMTTLSDYLICLLIAAATYLISQKVKYPPEIIQEAIEVAENSKDQAALDLIHEGEALLIQLQQAQSAIDDPQLIKQIRRIDAACRKILERCKEEPANGSKVRKLISYYQPTLIKLFNSYERIEDIEIRGEQMQTTLAEIEKAAAMGADAMEKQLDLLYADEALDISSDVDVLETLMKQQGLLDDHKK